MIFAKFRQAVFALKVEEELNKSSKKEGDQKISDEVSYSNRNQR